MWKSEGHWFDPGHWSLSGPGRAFSTILLIYEFGNIIFCIRYAEGSSVCIFIPTLLEETRVEETTKTKHKLSNSWVKNTVSPGKPVALLGKCFILIWDRTWPFELVFSRDNHIFFPRKIVILRKLLRSYWWFPLPTLFSCFFKVIIIWNSATWERWNSLTAIWLSRFGS